MLIGHVARMSEMKNQRFILELARKMEDCSKLKFVMVGDGPDFSEIKALAQDQSNIVLMGRRSDIPSLMKTFDSIALAFVIGCITLVIERKLNSRADEESMSEEYWLSDNESFLLYTGLLATVCRLMVFRMNIINRYSYYFLPFVLLLYPMSICNCKLRSNRRVVKWAVYIILGIYYVWMTVAYEASFHRTVPYEAFWQCNNGFFY